jgi:hypothetical protein
MANKLQLVRCSDNIATMNRTNASAEKKERALSGISLHPFVNDVSLQFGCQKRVGLAGIVKIPVNISILDISSDFPVKYKR